MTARIILQPGQIWLPSDREMDVRKITDFPHRMLSYSCISRTGEPSEVQIGAASNYTGEYLVTQAAFRGWIRENKAILTDQVHIKAAPGSELAKKIVTLRRAFGMNRSALANEPGPSRSSIAALETGRINSAHKHIPRLAEIFQMPVELPPDERDLIELYRLLAPERKLSFQKYVERRARQE